MSNMLILGGTGILGQAIAKEALDSGISVTLNGLDNNSLYPFLSIEDLKHDKTNWDSIVDVYANGDDRGVKVDTIFLGRYSQMFVISSTLVYDRSGFSYSRISEDNSLARKGSQGGYVDSKLQLEEYWNNRATILRPYHILGNGSALGCLPPHNRDVNLINNILSGTISLSDGGRIPLNVVHPSDIGKTLVSLIGKGVGESFNVVNPEEVIARDYYTYIASKLGVDLKITAIDSGHAWKNNSWPLTTLPHLYDVSKLRESSAYVPDKDFRYCIDSAMSHLATSSKDVFHRMHKLPVPKMHDYLV